MTRTRTIIQEQIASLAAALRDNLQDVGALVMEAAPAPRGTVPCINHGGARCAVCKGTGHEREPTDLLEWMARAKRCTTLAIATRDEHRARGCYLQAAQAWGRVVDLCDGQAKTLPIQSAVLSFNLAGDPGEARLIVVENAAWTNGYTLLQCGDVGMQILRRRNAMTSIRRAKASLRPTAHELGDE